MLGDCFEVGFIFLEGEGNGNSIRLMDLGEGDDSFIFLAEDDVSEGDNLGSSRARRLGIFARSAREEKRAIA